MLTNLQKLALQKLEVTADRDSITPGNYTVEPFTVQIEGVIGVGPDETYTPTADIPLIPTVALALKKMGIQRDHFLGVLKQAMEEVLLQDKKVRAALMEQIGLAEFERDFRTKVLAGLPNKTRNGKVTTALTVNEVVRGIIR